jgi:drug/metabolite transporter (DMT)-like permease
LVKKVYLMSNWKNTLLLFIPSTLWGVSFLLTEIILETIPPFTLTAWRNLIAIVPFLGLLHLVNGKLPRTWAGWWPYIIIGLFNNALPFVLVAWGQLYIESGLATILLSTMPLFTIILAHFSIADERMTRDKFIGVSWRS